MKSLDLLMFYLLIVANEAKVFKKCDLLQELKRLGLDGFRGYLVGHWMCVALFSSEFDTLHFERINGIPHYGIFQLSGHVWCKNGREKSQNRCNIHCKKFLDDDIFDDVECAKEAMFGTKNELMSWKMYRDYCLHPMPELVAWEC